MIFLLLLLVYTLPTALLGFFFIGGLSFLLLFSALLAAPLAYQSSVFLKAKTWREYLS